MDFIVDFKSSKPIEVDFNKSSGGTDDYNALSNKPQINGNELVGNKSLEDLDIYIPKNTSDLTNDSGFVTEADIPKNTSDLTNDSGFISQETDPTVPQWAKSPTKPTYTASEVGALPADTPIPTKTSDLTNNSGFISQETDPTVPSWAKASTKPTYTAQEVGALPTNTFIPTKLSDLINDDGYLKVTDLGVVDPKPYDDDVSVYFNTLTESGWYKFFWNNGDDLSYFIQVQSFEYDGETYVNQHYWGNEEGAIGEYIRGLLLEDGKVVDEMDSNYMTYASANNTFASKTHVHYRTDAKAVSVWDYCNTVALENAKPLVIYFDLSTSKTYLIETYMGVRQPVYKMQKVTEMNDISCFYQRSSYYYSGREHWGDWYKFTGTVFTPPTGR